MSHPEQLAWVERCVKEHSLADAPLVYEVGSLNVNGSPRGLFGAGEYVGFDVVSGKGVDVVVPAGFDEMRGILKPANVIVCCEVLEHDPYAQDTVHAMMQCLAPGGCLIITAAGPNRPEHGTRRTTGEVWGPNPDYYRNVTLADLRRWTELDGFWLSREYEDREDPSDVYFCGIAR